MNRRFVAGLACILFPALAGFLVLGPLPAVGPCEKSILVFPLLGHATWHAYAATDRERGACAVQA